MKIEDKIISIGRVSEANPDGCSWPVIFIEGCNLRCPYCINSNSIVVPADKNKSIPFEQVIKQLEDWGEDGVMISGGEALNQKEDIFELISGLRDAGYQVGISTNGTQPDQLKKAIQNNLISFVALDCKFNPSLSPEEMSRCSDLIGGYPKIEDDIISSLSIVFEWHTAYPEIAQSEIRITLYPEIINESDIASIAGMVHEKSKLMLQQYRRNTCFNGEKNMVEPYESNYIHRLVGVAKNNCKAEVGIRWP